MKVKNPLVEKKDRIYLVAKVTGLPIEEVRRKYAEFKKIAEDFGYEVVVPTEHVNPTAGWHEAMKICIPLLISCDCYALLDEPYCTTGGLIETTIAGWLNIRQVRIPHFKIKPIAEEAYP